MRRIFKYELLRQLKSKTFWGLSAITIIVAWQTLTTEVIMGIANTAPFSALSYRYYLLRTLPFLCVSTLCMLTLYLGQRERGVSELTHATPADMSKYAQTRCLAVATLMLTPALVVSSMVLVFNRVIFGVLPTPSMLILPALILIPAPVLTIGVGWRLGRAGSMALGKASCAMC